MAKSGQGKPTKLFIWFLMFLSVAGISHAILAQGVSTAGLNGLVTDTKNEPLTGAVVAALHNPSGTMYRTAVLNGGMFNIPNMRIGGPYTVVVSFSGYKPGKEENIYLNLGQNLRLDFELPEKALEFQIIQVTTEPDEVLNANRTSPATFIKSEEVQRLPSIKRSTRDLIRLDPRADGNYSFAGRNWLFNNISLDGSYFNNPFGLDDPAVGGQTAAEPIPYDAVEQVQVSIAPFDVRQSGFTGANINAVTKSGTNLFRGSVYSYPGFINNEGLLGNKVHGNKVIARPNLSFNQSGFTFSGPLMFDKVFFFVNGELERTNVLGTNFVANNVNGIDELGESRVRATTLDSIRTIMRQVYGYSTAEYEGFMHDADNDKLLMKLDWNINDNNNLTFRYNFLDARRALPAFVFSPNDSGRDPNENSLAFQNSGYQINNELHSFALELNSRGSRFANHFFFSYNRFRDFRVPFSTPFPTIQIVENGVTVIVGHEPFSIHNILDQDVFQFTDNFSLFRGKHALTFGANFEVFSFFNAVNNFRHGLFSLPSFVDTDSDGLGDGGTFLSLGDFLDATNPNSPNFRNFNAEIGTGPFKGENIDVGQLSLYAQDDFLISKKFNLTYGLRIDFPMYFTDPVDNRFSRELTLLDENDNTERVDQSDLPGASPLFSPRIGFNWDVKGNRSTQLRGGTGIFTGRVPFVWIGNVISNPGNNPNLFPTIALNQVPDSHRTSDDSILQQSFDLNAMDPDFKWPQVWNTNVAIDQKLPWKMLGTLELLYGKDINAIFMRNADLMEPVGSLPDGRPFFGGAGNNELNADDGAGVYVIDNTSAGWNFNMTAQLRKTFDIGLFTTLAYSYTDARNKHKTTEIASVLFQENPVQGDPNKPELSYAEFGQRHRILGGANYRRQWSKTLATSFGLFLEIAEGNTFLNGGNRFSVLYAGDVNGDGYSNDLIYIPRDAHNPSEILFADIQNGRTAAQQAQAFEAFIRQDDYLSSHRGEIAERFGITNPWYSNIDLRILQDFAMNFGGQKHTFQLSFDILNLGNLISSGWGVRKVANAAATRPLQFVRFNPPPPGNPGPGTPVFNFVGPEKTFVDDPSQLSRWRIQVGLRYLFN